MRLQHALCCVALIMLAACAAGPPPKTSVVVLPKPNGQVGAVVVRPVKGGKPVVLDKAYVEATIGDARTVQTATVDAKQVNREFAESLSALPNPPVTYLVHFSEGTDELNPDTRRTVERAIAEAASRPSPEIIVIGHTDFLGGHEYNDRLSILRAERVRELLVQRGVPARSIQVSGRGKREPLYPTPANVAEPRNRRVEITVR
jgi:outer membrane protein OmpA-like peptidoglycan-associated protein